MKIGEFSLVQELKNISSIEIKKSIKNEMKDSQGDSIAKQLLSLCQVFTKKIDIITRKQYIKSLGSTITLYDQANDLQNNALENELYVYGTRLIYMLRSFLMNENIDFHFNATVGDNKTIDALVPQKKVLKSLQALNNGHKKAIGIPMKIQKELISNGKNMTLKSQGKKTDLWNRVVHLSRGEYQRGDEPDDEIRGHQVHKSVIADFMVYFMFTGKKKTISRYYKMGNNEFILFNLGRLKESYSDQYYNTDAVTWKSYHETEVKRGSIKPFIRPPDYTRGTKQGDWVYNNNIQVQEKYNNEKIISYNNIRQVIYELQMALEVYLTEKQSGAEKISMVLEEHFYPEVGRVGTEFVVKKTEEILKILETKV